MKNLVEYKILESQHQNTLCEMIRDEADSVIKANEELGNYFYHYEIELVGGLVIRNSPADNSMLYCQAVAIYKASGRA